MNAIGNAVAFVLIMLAAWFVIDAPSLGRSVRDFRQLASVERCS